MQRIARSFLSKRAGDSIPYTMAPKRPFPNGNASVHTCAGRSYLSLFLHRWLLFLCMNTTGNKA